MAVRPQKQLEQKQESEIMSDLAEHRNVWLGCPPDSDCHLHGECIIHPLSWRKLEVVTIVERALLHGPVIDTF